MKTRTHPLSRLHQIRSGSDPQVAAQLPEPGGIPDLQVSHQVICLYQLVGT